MGEFWVIWSRSCRCLCASWSSRESKENKPDLILKRKGRKVSAIHEGGEGKEQKSRPMCKTQRNKLHATLAYPHPPQLQSSDVGRVLTSPFQKVSWVNLSYPMLRWSPPLLYASDITAAYGEAGIPLADQSAAAEKNLTIYATWFVWQ